jgi:choline monooxygenase
MKQSQMSKFYVDPDIALAKTLDTSFYNDDVVFNSAKEKIFSKCWLYLGNANELDNHNVIPVEPIPGYLNDPLLLSKDKEGIHCLSNVCTHRGNLLIDKACKANDLRCNYHGRRFKLDGQFVSMPEFKEVKNFPSDTDHLHKLKLFNWHGLLFTNLEHFLSTDQFFKPMIDRVKWMPLDKMVYRPDLSKDYHVNANWALYCENYLEGFHIPFVHAGLNAVIDYGDYSTELFEYSSVQLGYSKKEQDVFTIPTGEHYHGKLIAGMYFFIFPNMMFNFYPWGLSLNIVNPKTINTCTINFKSFVWDESKLNLGAGAALHEVEMEDEAIVENVQKGIQSRFYKHGRYSVTREQGTHHFHRLLSKFMNA